jgi:hypothetical protein
VTQKSENLSNIIPLETYVLEASVAHIYHIVPVTKTILLYPEYYLFKRFYNIIYSKYTRTLYPEYYLFKRFYNIIYSKYTRTLKFSLAFSLAYYISFFGNFLTKLH